MGKNEKGIKLSHVILIGVVAIAVLSYMGYIDLSSFLPSSIEPEPAGLVSVTKPVDFYVLDKYAGSGIQSVILKIYDSDNVMLEQITTASDGTIVTSASYPSGTLFHIQATVSGQYEKEWYEVTVPKMSNADAQSLTVNGPISLKFFDYTAPTISVRDSAGNAYVDTADLNKTVVGNTPVLTVTWYQPTDNDGVIVSYDPINDVNWKCLLIVKVSNTNYEYVQINGFSASVEKGSAMYYMYEINPETLTKWKVGNDYNLAGTGSVTFSMDLSGYSGDSADMDLYIYYYSDWNNFLSTGSFGPDSLSVISGAPHTIDLTD